MPARNVRELGSSLTVNTSRTRRLFDLACSALLTLVWRVLRLGAAVFDWSWLPVMVWLTPGPGTALKPLVEPDVEAEPAEMLAAQQTATRPTAAVAATRR